MYDITQVIYSTLLYSYFLIISDLAQVTGVKSHSITNNSFILEWVKAAGYYDHILVQCRNCSYTQVYRSVPETSNRITFTNLKSGALYVVRMITMRNGFMDGEAVLYTASTCKYKGMFLGIGTEFSHNFLLLAPQTDLSAQGHSYNSNNKAQAVAGCRPKLQ